MIGEVLRRLDTVDERLADLRGILEDIRADKHDLCQRVGNLESASQRFARNMVAGLAAVAGGILTAWQATR